VTELELNPGNEVSRPDTLRPIRASLVIATYRRPVMLRDTLLGLREQETNAEGIYEVIVIDNDPDGSACSVVEAIRRDWPQTVPLRYIHEKRVGLSFARNRGIDESRGEIIGFLDDDLFIPPHWLSAILTCFEQTGAACVGGRTLIHWEGEPDPVVRSCEDNLGVDMGERDVPMQGRQVPGGGNAAFRRSVFAGGLRFCTDLGRVGKVLLSGEDSELMERLKQSGQSIWYCAAAVVGHRTGGEQLTAERIVRLRYWFGISYAIMDRRLYGKGYQLARALARTGKAVLVDVPKWLVGVLAWGPKRRLLARCALAKQIGYVVVALSIVTVTPRRDGVPG
jgi:glycosyltransferase involved in cell wall biosynthesis